MHQAHWGLSRSPFNGSLDPHHYFESPTHEEAAARLEFLVESRRRFALLTGPEGVGKSLTLEVFQHRLRKTGRSVAKVSAVAAEPRELMWRLAAAGGLSPEQDAGEFSLGRMLADHLAERRHERRDSIWLIDDSDRSRGAVTPVLERFLAEDARPDGRLAVVAAARGLSEISSRLLELVDLRVELDPWEREDTEHYLQHCAEGAGRAAPLFGEEAAARLHELSRGLPRRINRLAELSLVAGAGRGLDRIDAETVDSVQQELALGG